MAPTSTVYFKSVSNEEREIRRTRKSPGQLKADSGSDLGFSGETVSVLSRAASKKDEETRKMFRSKSRFLKGQVLLPSLKEIFMVGFTLSKFEIRQRMPEWELRQRSMHSGFPAERAEAQA